VGLDEVCQAYSNFPNGGTHPGELYLITKITDSDDNVLYRRERKPEHKVKGMDPIAAFQIHSCLQEALKTGTASRSGSELGLVDFMGGGKTGTYHDYKDLWFVGYNKKITCAVWVGFDRPKTIYEKAFSNKVALPLWVNYMNAAGANFPSEPIKPPPNGVLVEICTKSGQRATDRCYETIPSVTPGSRTRFVRTTTVEVMRPGTSALDYCLVHAGQDPNPEAEIIQPIAPVPMQGIDPSMDPLGAAMVATPVSIKSPTIVGEDPYQSMVPAPKAEVIENIPKAGVVTGNEADIPKAVPLDSDGNPIESDVVPAARPVRMELGNPAARVKIPLPPPIPLQ
jgi:membrane peptidoglycan carboxypeptidase